MGLTYLALGDSYTIGEGVLPEDNFPSQTVRLLNADPGVSGAGEGITFHEPVIIAKTGWTTDELDAAIDEAALKGTFDLVTLLIGVNNQYRGRSVSEYKVQFDHLLQRAIGFAGNKTNRVYVLSIPDWGVTPFADGRDRNEIARMIDEYNESARTICLQHQVVFIDITTDQRKNGNQPEFLVGDQLHPAKKEYEKWASRLFSAIRKNHDNEQ
ncbi:MAG: SGNH/GDSL hydrolase family protein [Chitinophagaceae bacterium]|nr:SGNH/GDSL hydrolase family protein [Chitinophagaceae bacterium]